MIVRQVILAGYLPEESVPRVLGRGFWLRAAVVWLVCELLLTPAQGTDAVARAADAPPVQLSGHVLTRLATAHRLAPVAADLAMTLTVALRPRAGVDLADVVDAQRANPGATTMTPATFGQRYGQPH